MTRIWLGFLVCKKVVIFFSAAVSVALAPVS
jgi:hypothetical protein